MEPKDPAPFSEPRIRHITGIGIHELTLDTTTGSGLPFPPPSGSPRARRTSHAGLDVPIGRARAPTLAGEGYAPFPPSTSGAFFAPPLEESSARRPLMRCFVTLSIPEDDRENKSENESPSSSSRPESPLVSSSPSSPHSHSPQSPRARDRQPARTRTISLPPKPTRNPGVLRSASPTSPTFSPTASPVSRRPHLNGSAHPASTKARPAPVRRSTLGYSGRAASDIGTTRRPPTVPFFFSPIHSPSTHPRWAHLEAGDLAPWLTVPEGAGTKVEIKVWIEEEKEKQWRQLPDVGGIVDLTRLVPIPRGQDVPPNTLQWTLSTHPKSVFYLPPAGSSEPDRDAMKRIVERSLRETRMKKGATFGALHSLVNIQSVIADTQRSIEDLQRRIDTLIVSDADRAAQKRDVSERALRVHWIRDRVSEVERTTEQTKARITLHRGRLHSRRALLVAAVEREEADKSKIMELSAAITQVESQRSALLPQIHKLRATHTQTLDFIFPIVSIHAQSLLYSILGVPLPIPIGPKDPAPPLSLPPSLIPEGCPKFDERTTAAALGYAAILVHLISSLGGAAAGLAYPVTFAGSRSHVRDVVSAMQGPRSFPLYAKGVERYRFEYAVFLLNKDIEMLMLEADIRMLDLRHTLPNLKNLLVTLSSPDPPSPGPVAGPGWASGAASRASSRKPSAAWAFQPRSSSTLCLDPSMSFMSTVTIGNNKLNALNISPTAHSASLASASIHSICPTNEDASISASAAVSPLPWRRALADKERDRSLSLSVQVQVDGPKEPVGFVVGSPSPEREGSVDQGQAQVGGESGRESGGESGNDSDDESDGTQTAEEKR